MFHYYKFENYIWNSLWGKPYNTNWQTRFQTKFNWTLTSVCNNNNQLNNPKTQSVRQTSTPRSIVYRMKHTMIYTIIDERQSITTISITTQHKKWSPGTSTSRGKPEGSRTPRSWITLWKNAKRQADTSGNPIPNSNTINLLTSGSSNLESFQLLLLVHLPQASSIGFQRNETPVARTMIMQ